MISMTRSVHGFIVAFALAALVGCTKPADAGADGGASSTSAASGGKKPKATLKMAEMKAAWSKQMDGTAQMNVPMDKKISALLTTFGPPSEERPGHKVWYALDGSGGCSKEDLDMKDGSMSDSSTDKSSCGL